MPNPPAFTELVAATRTDCVRGLAAHDLVVMEFLLLPPTDDPTAPLGNRTHTAISWEVCALQGAPPSEPDVWTETQSQIELPRGADQLFISGITIINHTKADPSEWRYERHIDWAAFHSQLPPPT